MSFENALNRCLAAAKLRRMSIHDLRHTYATIRLLRGHNVGDVSYQLGHASIKMTYDVYTHWMPGKFKKEVDDLDNPRPKRTLLGGCNNIYNDSNSLSWILSNPPFDITRITSPDLATRTK